jgi:hypothetical protein
MPGLSLITPVSPTCLHFHLPSSSYHNAASLWWVCHLPLIFRRRKLKKNGVLNYLVALFSPSFDVGTSAKRCAERLGTGTSILCKEYRGCQPLKPRVNG